MKEIKLIEAFAGYGSQRMALENIGYKLSKDSGIIEWTADAIVAYASAHHIEEFEKEMERINYVLDKWDGDKKVKLIDTLLSNYTLSSEKKKVEGSYIPLDMAQYKRWPIEKLVQLYAACIVSNNYGSIMDTKGDILNDIDLFTYSFPCQDLSLAGKMRGITETSRSGLLYQVERMLKEQAPERRPKYLLMENVKNLVGSKFKPDFDRWVETLKELGYETSWKVLNAREHGIPQNRERVFALSTRKDLPMIDITKIEKKPLEKRLKHFLEDKVDESYYLSNDHIQRILGWKAYEKPLKKVLHGDSVNIGTITTRSGDDTSSQKLVLEKVDIVGNVSPSGHGQGGNVYSPNGIAPTFTENHGGVMKIIENNKDNLEEQNHIDVEDILNGKNLVLGINPTSPKYQSDNVIHGENYYISTLRAGNGLQLVAVRNDEVIPLRIRKITPKEAFRLMGVNDNAIDNMSKYVTTKSAQYKLAGNSIVVQVLEEIFKELYNGSI